MSQVTQKAPLIKAKYGKQLGYNTPDNFRSRTFGGKVGGSVVKFDPARFKTQHKG